MRVYANTHTNTHANTHTNTHTNAYTNAYSHMIIYLHGVVVFMEYQIHALLREFDHIFGSDEDRQVREYMLILMASSLDTRYHNRAIRDHPTTQPHI